MSDEILLKTVPADHFSGNSSITEGNVRDSAIGDLASILNNAYKDLGGILEVDCTGGATADFDYTVPVKTSFRVIDAWAVLLGAGTTSDTYQIKKGSTALSDAVDIAAAGDKDIARIGELDNDEWDFTTDDVLKVTLTDGGGSDVPALKVFIKYIRTA